MDKQYVMRIVGEFCCKCKLVVPQRWLRDIDPMTGAKCPGCGHVVCGTCGIQTQVDIVHG